MSYFIHLLLLTGLSLVIIQWKTLYNKERFYKYALFFIINFSLRLVLIYFNEELNFFADKLSGAKAVTIHQYYQLSGISEAIAHAGNFILQWFINFPFFELNGPARYTLLINNAYIGSVIPLFVAYFLKDIYGEKFENFCLIAFSFFLCFINFSIFGIRDIIILGIVSANAVSVIYLFKLNAGLGSLFKTLITYGTTLFLIVYIRPEMLPILSLPGFIFLLSRIGNFINNLHDRYSRIIAAFMTLTVFVLTAYFLADLTTSYLSRQVGATGDVFATDIVDTFAEQRYDRQFRSAGGGSAIVGPNIYHNLSTPSRLSIQIVGMVVIPFPWEIDSVTKLFAFFDTVLVLYLIVCLCRFFFRQLKSSGTYMHTLLANPLMALGITFIFAIILYGFLVINFGNAFRLRMSILPYLIIPAIYFLSQKN